VNAVDPTSVITGARLHGPHFRDKAFKKQSATCSDVVVGRTEVQLNEPRIGGITVRQSKLQILCFLRIPP
jgi:hypothetical protein